MKNINRFLFPALILIIVSIACASTANSPAGAPETGYRYDSLPNADEAGDSVSRYKAISQWGKADITFFFANGTDKINGDRERDLIREAFVLWAKETPLAFTEVASASQADIVISWAQGNHGDGDPFDGPGDVLAHASYPNPYSDRQVFLHFDDAERWVDSDTQNVDLLTVAAHEIGHNLGLDHSNDPKALMYPSYSGPHRFLGKDDIAGVQSLYGLASTQPQAPEAPPQGATAPPSANTDSDRDGISDEDEVLRTGTDPAKADTDGDGLSDGVEVIYNMNPLDADMDKDGVKDGQEVAQGTDPFFPDQNADVSPELSKEVSDFLTEAIQAQIEAYRQNNAALAANILAGDLLASLEQDIALLKEKGLVQLSEIDYYKSYIDDIRVINNSLVEVDTCETWTTNIYAKNTGELTRTVGPNLLPQTITIEKLSSGWFITKVKFFDAPAFCNE